MTRHFKVREAREGDVAQLAEGFYAFEVRSVFIEPFDGSDLIESTLAVPYEKIYDFDATSLKEHIGNAEAALFVVDDLDFRPRGYIAVSHFWNGYASIDDLAVDQGLRRLGAAKLLMNAAANWAQQEGLAGLRLETQNNNVAACKFYKQYGFILGGYDQYLYSGIQTEGTETALFWYLRFL